MKLKIPFDEIKDALETASFEHHCFVDKSRHEIVFISECEDGYEKNLKKVEGDDFIAIEPRMPDDDFKVMESFIYEIQNDNFALAERFHKALERTKPFRNFKELLNLHPEFREKWFEHRDKQIKNETMNWLCINDIKLEDCSFMPKIEIKELKPPEVKIPEEFEGFSPVECMNCKNKYGIKTRYFELNTPAENMFIEKEIKRIMKEKYELERYGHISGGEKEILTSSECPKCKSGEIFEDFKA
ncbi:hypothetical protein HZA97_07220 [Candidatus Woesearchaeota archaeon]|nr:hypothetical protein [Candidatus Woesearchaeota archaeon]